MRSTGGPAATRGAVTWAVVAAVPDAPLRMWCGDDAVDVRDAASLARDVSASGSASRTLLIEARLRPVVLLQDRPRGVLGEALGLALVGLERLSEPQRERVREQREPSLFHLPVRPGKYGLHREMAVDLNALVRVGGGAMLPRHVGRLDANEMRVIGERLVDHLDVDLEPVVARHVEERLAELSGPAML